jgi:hypothetical protein
MGFVIERLPVVSRAFSLGRFPITNMSIEDIRVYDDRTGRIIPLLEVKPAVEGGFRPHFGWSCLKHAARGKHELLEKTHPL